MDDLENPFMHGCPNVVAVAMFTSIQETSLPSSSYGADEGDAPTQTFTTSAAHLSHQELRLLYELVGSLPDILRTRLACRPLSKSPAGEFVHTLAVHEDEIVQQERWGSFPKADGLRIQRAAVDHGGSNWQQTIKGLPQRIRRLYLQNLRCSEERTLSGGRRGLASWGAELAAALAASACAKQLQVLIIYSTVCTQDVDTLLRLLPALQHLELHALSTKHFGTEGPWDIADSCRLRHLLLRSGWMPTVPLASIAAITTLHGLHLLGDLAFIGPPAAPKYAPLGQLVNLRSLHIEEESPWSVTDLRSAACSSCRSCVRHRAGSPAQQRGGSCWASAACASCRWAR